jgi:mRNA interferase MazF
MTFRAEKSGGPICRVFYSVVNVSQVLTLDRSFLTEHAGTLSARPQRSVDAGLRFVLQL